jgi:radical SAM superfamily enzyme YgiQ (UPF0313 family)
MQNLGLILYHICYNNFVNILAINPWIVDCAAYDFWLKPYGFLVILTYLKNKRVNIDYIDCLNNKISKDSLGRGKIYCQNIEKPPPLKGIPRYFKRYGIETSRLKDLLKNKKPDYIILTSSMTYWYPAIIDLTKILKKTFSQTPIILGGTYPTLCYEHAKSNISCDFIFKNTHIEKFFSLLNTDFDYELLYSTLPSYENFYNDLDYVVLRTSWGCPFSCSYCAIKELFPGFFRISYKKIVPFIIKYRRKGIKHFILYDDAFLYEIDYAKKLLKEISNLNLNINFHTPNALHLRFLDEEIASLLKKTGFINPHFGLETLNPKLQKLWGDKVNRDDLIKGAEILKKAGFSNGQFSVYLLLGYPGQNLESLREEVKFINSLGARVSLSEFSPVPHTEIFEAYKTELTEPLLHNNSIFSLFHRNKIKEFWEIKNYVRELNRKLVI